VLAFLKGRIDASLAILDKRLVGRAFALGERPTIAIFRCAPICIIRLRNLASTSALHPNISTWLDRIKALRAGASYELMPGIR
jgi:glutathione S-transferase